MKFVTVAMFLGCMPALAANAVYVGINSAGTNDGSSCTNRKAASYFNTASNWSSNPTGIQIGPGTTVHFCGTDAGALNTTAFTFQGNGASGNPVTFLFEFNADLNSPAWAVNGAINCNGHSYITIDGGKNGRIDNTANGDLLANHIVTAGISSSGGTCSNMVVQNLAISNLFIKVQNNSSTVDDSAGINLFGTNSRITNNKIDHVATGIGSGNSSHHEIDHNTFSVYNHAVTDGSSNTLVDDIKIHDNIFAGGAQVYDTSSDAYHRNGIIIVCESGLQPCVTNLQIYNNYFYGIMSQVSTGGQTTSLIFLDDYTSSNIQNALVYNNVLATAAGDTGIANGFLTSLAGAPRVYNNTFVSTVNGAGNCIYPKNVPGAIFENNIFQGCAGIYMPSGSGGAVFDYNRYYQIPSTGWNFGTFTQWQGSGFDLHSTNGTSPGLVDSTGCTTGTLSGCQLAAGASAAQHATNLSSLGISTLDSDFLNSARPAGTCTSVGQSACWDQGAFQVPSPLLPPTNTVAVSK